MRTLWILPLLIAGPAAGQGTKTDYERASHLYWNYNGLLERHKVQPVWIPDGLWYRVPVEEGKYAYFLVDARTGKREPLFDADRLKATLGEIAPASFSMDKVPPDRIELSADRATLSFPLNGNRATYDRRDHSVGIGGPVKDPEKRPRPGAESNPWRAYAEGGTLFLENRVAKSTAELAPPGKDYRWEGSALFAPDRKKLIAFKTYPGQYREVKMIESSPRDQIQPRERTNAFYAKPGDKLTVSKPQLFDLDTLKEIPVDDALFPNPYELRGYRWEPDSSRFTFEYNARGHGVYRVLAVDAATGTVSTVVSEEPKTFFDYAGKHFIHWRGDKPELFWMSERSGWNHIYRIDSKTGRVINAVTAGEWVVRGVEFVDEAKEQMTLRVGGIDPKEDPYHVHYIRVNFDGTGLVRLTEADATHAVVFSPDRKYLVDTYSRADSPGATELRYAETGQRVATLEKADDARLRVLGWKPPERFVAKGRDGSTDIYGLIHRPGNFDPAKTYPVIEQIYAGPHDSHVPKAFRVYDRVREYAELGFIVVQIDGMGTSNRSKAFHDVCWKNLGDAGFPDRIAWMKAAAAKHPEMDLTRVGIYGGSAGGQNAMRALIAHGDFYKAAAADCGCHDNRMDKIWWNELWMGWPVGPQYEAASNVVHAGEMRGKLLLTVGELDRNVDPASTMQVANALIKADKDFELIVVPGADHGAGDLPYANRRRMDFFVRALMGVEPRQK